MNGKNETTHAPTILPPIIKCVVLVLMLFLGQKRIQIGRFGRRAIIKGDLQRERMGDQLGKVFTWREGRLTAMTPSGGLTRSVDTVH